jgi:hypothetical protein
VTYREALAVLGLGEADGLTPDQIRRTYLRKLKEHPPERDPDGFARLRAAFELLRGERVAPLAVPVRAVVLPEPPVEAEPIDADAPPVPLAPPPVQVIVLTLLELIRAGDVDKAKELELAWRSDHGDDCTRTSPDVAARWLLTSELVGVAPELPAPVRNALADAIQHGEFGAARERLTLFRHTDAWRAGQLDGLLARRAKALHACVEGTLWVTPRADRPVQRARGGNLNYGWLIGIAVLTLIRILTAGTADDDRSGRSSAPAADEVVLPTTSAPPPDAAPAAPPRWPPPPDPNASHAQLLAEITDEASHIASDGAPAQRRAAAAMQAAVTHRNCDQMRGATRTMFASLTAKGVKTQPHTRDDIVRINDRVAWLCPGDRMLP